MGGSIWDHDLWQDIYSISDADTKVVAVNLYRLILDIRNREVEADNVARRVRADRAAEQHDRTVKLTTFQKVIGILVGSTVFADAVRGLIFG